MSGLVFQGHDGFSVAAEGGDFLQVAVGLGQGHHWSVAVNCVAVGCEVPASGGMLLQVAGRPTHRRRWLGNRQTKQQG